MESSHNFQSRVDKKFREMFSKFLYQLYTRIIYVTATVRHFRFNASATTTNETNSSFITYNCCNTIRCRESLTCIKGSQLYVVNNTLFKLSDTNQYQILYRIHINRQCKSLIYQLKSHKIRLNMLKGTEWQIHTVNKDPGTCTCSMFCILKSVPMM